MDTVTASLRCKEISNCSGVFNMDVNPYHTEPYAGVWMLG